MFVDEIASRLVAQGVGTLNSSIFCGSAAVMPEGVGPYLTVTETGGTAPTRVQNQNAAATQKPTAQISVRAKSYTDARTMSKNAYVALDGVFNTSLAGTFYVSITARQEPTDTGALDGAGRVVIVFNIDAEKYFS